MFQAPVRNVGTITSANEVQCTSSMADKVTPTVFTYFRASLGATVV
jgi:hypothetical protein